MKPMVNRVSIILLIALFLGVQALTGAQDSTDDQTLSVLEEARRRYEAAREAQEQEALVPQTAAPNPETPALAPVAPATPSPPPAAPADRWVVVDPLPDPGVKDEDTDCPFIAPRISIRLGLDNVGGAELGLQAVAGPWTAYSFASMDRHDLGSDSSTLVLGAGPGLGYSHEEFRASVLVLAIAPLGRYVGDGPWYRDLGGEARFDLEVKDADDWGFWAGFALRASLAHGDADPNRTVWIRHGNGSELGLSFQERWIVGLSL